MITENENTLRVSNEELLEDIRITKMEQEAYQSLVDGFITLSGIPENIGTEREKKYKAEAQKFSSLDSQCSDFLKKLYDLKKFRGI